MRNVNIEFMYIPASGNASFILTMRNVNLPAQGSITTSPSFYINYEECKSRCIIHKCVPVCTFYINYEECKYKNKSFVRALYCQFYINYEECKLEVRG